MSLERLRYCQKRRREERLVSGRTCLKTFLRLYVCGVGGACVRVCVRFGVFVCFWVRLCALNVYVYSLCQKTGGEGCLDSIALVDDKQFYQGNLMSCLKG